MERERRIITYSGKLVNVIDPDPETIDIHDIAHALANQCRFGGHTKIFYSVAQHSLLVAAKAPAKYKLEALMHDAAEAYLIDLPRPVKRLLPDYDKMENNLMMIIALKFGFKWPMPKVVREADDKMMLLEIASLLDDGWPSPIQKMNAPDLKFLELFYDLMKLQHG